MSDQAITNGLVRLGGYDLTGDTNKIASSYGVAALDNTALGSKTKTNTAGLKTTKLSVAGFWESANDAAIYNDISLTDIITYGFTNTEGGIDFFQKAMQASYVTGDQVGKLMPFSLTAEAAGDLIRGTLIANKTGISASGHGTGFQLGAVGSAQSLYAALHLTALSGSATPTITCIIQSSADDTFGSPTTRITFNADTAIGAQLAEVAGAITDTWFRVAYTITGTIPSFNFAVSVGIQ
jgi:hypothetical protein